MKFSNKIKDPRQKFIGRKAEYSSAYGVVCGYSSNGKSLIMALDNDNFWNGWPTSIFDDYIDPKYKNNLYGYYYINENNIL